MYPSHSESKKYSNAQQSHSAPIKRKQLQIVNSNHFFTFTFLWSYLEIKYMEIHVAYQYHQTLCMSFYDSGYCKFFVIVYHALYLTYANIGDPPFRLKHYLCSYKGNLIKHLLRRLQKFRKLVLILMQINDITDFSYGFKRRKKCLPNLLQTKTGLQELYLKCHKCTLRKQKRKM